MEKQNSNTGIFYLLGVVFAALTGGLIAESFLAAVVGAVVGLFIAWFFVKVLLPEREHDR
ncbi:hypothetical protein SAMN05216436_10881 [bacterium A37T11]|nr:hypothetical protein SAMN05216436_10881 [bacterium A37T11]